MRVHIALVEHSQKIRCAGQIWIEPDEHAAGDGPDLALENAGDILDDVVNSTRQCRVAANCLMAEADSPGTVMDDVPSCEGRTKPLNPDPAGGM